MWLVAEGADEPKHIVTVNGVMTSASIFDGRCGLGSFAGPVSGVKAGDEPF